MMGSVASTSLPHEASRPLPWHIRHLADSPASQAPQLPSPERRTNQRSRTQRPSEMAKTINKATKNPKKTAAVGDLFAAMEKPQRTAAKASRVSASSGGDSGYTAKHIEVLEG